MRFTGAQVLPIITNTGGLNLLLSAGVLLVGYLDEDMISEVSDQTDSLVDITIDVVDDGHGQDEIKMLNLCEILE